MRVPSSVDNFTHELLYICMYIYMFEWREVNDCGLRSYGVLSRCECFQNFLSGSFLFNCLEEKDMQIVVGAMKSRNIPEEMQLIKQGDDGECLYLIEEGRLQCFVNVHPSGPDSDGQPPQQKMVKEVGPGDVIGELALLYNAPRAATVRSITPSVVWRLDRDTFNAIVKDSATKKREMYDEFLKKVMCILGVGCWSFGVEICMLICGMSFTVF